MRPDIGYQLGYTDSIDSTHVIGIQGGIPNVRCMRYIKHECSGNTQCSSRLTHRWRLASRSSVKSSSKIAGSLNDPQPLTVLAVKRWSGDKVLTPCPDNTDAHCPTDLTATQIKHILMGLSTGRRTWVYQIEGEGMKSTTPPHWLTLDCA